MTIDTHVNLSPLGPWYKLNNNPIITSVDNYLPENFVYDPVTKKYWLIFSNFGDVTGVFGVGIAQANDPAGPWTVTNPTLIISTDGNLAPHLMLDGGLWHIFYSKVGTGGKITLFHRTSTTPNGVYGGETEVLLTGAPGTWDDERVMETYVFKDDDNIYKMFYMGDATAPGPGAREQVGLATAAALAGPWTKAPGNPVIPFGAAGTYDEGVVADPFCFKVNGTYYIFYAGGIASTALLGDQCLATSIDLLAFTKRGIAVPRGPLGSYDDGVVARGAITLVGDNYWMPYAGLNATTGKYQICMAVAPARSNRKF